MDSRLPISRPVVIRLNETGAVSGIPARAGGLKFMYSVPIGIYSEMRIPSQTINHDIPITKLRVVRYLRVP